MTNTLVEFRHEDSSYELELDDIHAPCTVAAFLANLPLDVALHGAKVAGNQFYWHAPFLTPYETTTDITTIKAGTLVYFPERQFVEVIFGELHPEVANINVIGRFRGDIAWLKALGHRIIIKGAQSVGNASLCCNFRPQTTEAVQPPATGWLHEERLRIWAGQPREISELIARRGLMLPLGPLLFADSEMRGLHEKLSRLWLKGDEADLVRIGRFAIELAADRLEGHCGLHDVTALLRGALALIVEGPELRNLLHELILYVSQFSSWLDRAICWYDLNEAFNLTMYQHKVGDL